MNIIFFSHFDALIEFENNSVEIYANNFKKFIISNENVLIKVTPKSLGDCLTYFFKLRVQNSQVFYDCDFVQKIEVNSYIQILILNKNFIKTDNSTQKLSTIKNDYEVKCLSNVKILCGNQQIISKNICAKSANIYIKNSLIFCEIDLGDLTNLIVFDEMNNVLIDQYITQIEHTTNGFNLLMDFKDIHKQGLVKKYEIKENELVLTSEYPVCIKSKLKEIFNENCNILAFFECIRAKNISLAKKYCTKSLADNMSNNHINFFGEFDEIFLLDDLTVCLLDFKNLKSKTFKLKIYNNLIDNIED